MIEPIEITVALDATPKAAFDAFCDHFNDWWPKTPFSMSAGTLALERGLNGQVTETANDGTLHIWGHITGWEDGKLIELSWYVGRRPDTATTVSIRFDPTDDGRCGLTLIQSNWEALGKDAIDMRARNDAGWTEILGRGFATYIATHRS